MTNLELASKTLNEAIEANRDKPELLDQLMTAYTALQQPQLDKKGLVWQTLIMPSIALLGHDGLEWLMDKLKGHKAAADNAVSTLDAHTCPQGFIFNGTECVPNP